jgi:hypothetical protein
MGAVTAIGGRGGATAPTGALATTGPAGGREAIAGAAGGAETTCGAGLGCGTMTLRGSGRGGAAAGSAGAAGAAAIGAAGGGATCAGLAGACACRASSSSSFFLARMAFITSPGLETWERSILGAMPCGPRDAWEPPCPADRVPRSNCARTFSASKSSRELECVLPLASPSSVRTSRICRLLTSISRARSLIRTLLIRLFSKFASIAS